VEKVDWKWEAEKILRRYKYLPTEIRSLEIQIKLAKRAGPKITPQYKLRVSSGGFSTTSSTENYVFSVEQLEERLQHAKDCKVNIEKAMTETFTPDERFIYERRFRDEFTTEATAIEMHVSIATFFRMQELLLKKVAWAMEMGVPREELPPVLEGELYVRKSPRVWDE